MAVDKPDFFVIYNRALNPKAETDDTRMSFKFTTKLVDFLESKGHKGLYDDRDSKPGANIFHQLKNNVKNTMKTMVVVTPEFLRNCWATYSSQSTFKHLLDSQETGKLIPIGVDISDNQKLEELNIIDWIHFTKDWEKEQNSQKWDIISKVFDHDGPLSIQPAYREYKHAQEHGDNKLRTDNDGLVVQVVEREFLTERFLQGLGESFPAEWEILAIKLGVKDTKIQEVKRDNTGNVRMQAYCALMSWKESHGGLEEQKVKCLLSVLEEMGRNNLKEDIERKFEEFTKSQDSNQDANEGLDEVDMGMSRPRSKVHRVDNDQTSDKQVKQNLMVSKQKEKKGGGEPQHTSYVAREMKAEKTVVIEAKAKPAPANTPLDTVKLQQGPSMSLPSADVKKPSSQSSEPSDDTSGKHRVFCGDSLNIVEKGSHGYKRDCGDSIDGPINHEPKIEEHILATNCQALNMKTSDVRPATQQISNAIESNLENQMSDKVYNSQQSLSKDDDLSADVNGSYSFKRPISTEDIQAVRKPSNLNINQSSQDETKEDNDTPDSGCYSRTETPLNEQTIAKQGKSPQTAKKMEENVDQSEKNKRNQPIVSVEMRKNQTGQEENSAPHLESIENANGSCQAIEQEESTQKSPHKPESMNDCKSNNQQVNGELNSTQQSEQGPFLMTTILVSRVFSAVGGILLRPELAYN